MSKIERPCIRVPKVYDWITPQTEKEFQFSTGDIDFFTTEDPHEQTTDTLVDDVCAFVGDAAAVSCVLLKPHVKDIKKGDGICQEVGLRRDVMVEEIDTVLQLVRLKKQGQFQIILDGTDVAGVDRGKRKGKGKRRKPVAGVGTGPIFSEPISFFNIERFLLCAPEGTDVICHVTDFECEGALICNGAEDADWTIDLILLICQSIQVETDVKIAVDAEICRPRDEIALPIDVCPEITFPDQCPEIFPQPNNKC